MKITTHVLLRDVPGSLISALEPIASHGGNIISVLHNRTDKDLVDVEISFMIKDRKTLELIQQELENRKIKIKSIEIDGKKYMEKCSISLLFIGHVIDTDIRDTIDRINTVALVSDVDVVMTSPSDKSSVLMNIELDNHNFPKLEKVIEEICREKNLLAIKSLEV
ncbi:MAG TPA: hypothetical protein ENG50_00110 [Candidatus Altiarchaeales archaeon]|nr:MAG: hypothetical protein DRO65_01390 [Candidatus Altiarchaeales archaeon]HDN82749.1 hypothetical protein [Candidatus Altiarchaeales archaeon]